MTAAFSSNWMSGEAQSAFTNAYENVFFASPISPFLFPLSIFRAGSISMRKINETDKLLTQFDAPQLWRFYKYWNHLSADRQKKDRIAAGADPEPEPQTESSDASFCSHRLMVEGPAILGRAAYRQAGCQRGRSEGAGRAEKKKK